MMRMINCHSPQSLLKQFRYSRFNSPTVQVLAVTSMHCSKVVEKSNSDARLPVELVKAIPAKEKAELVTVQFEKLKTVSVPTDMNNSFIRLKTEAQADDKLLNVMSVMAVSENDPRFSSVCKLLASSKTPTVLDDTSKDLNSILGFASDEAAKLVSNISLPQMINVLAILASKKRRPTPLLRSLAFNISSSVEKLDTKQCADALYAAATLNFHDDMLLERVCSDICNCLMNNSRRADVRSIIKSLGLLRYNHIDVLNFLSEWIQTHKKGCAQRDLVSLLMTLAVVNHLPSNHDALFPMIRHQLSNGGVLDPHEWLDAVWALTVLEKETSEDLSSVLSSEFLNKIRAHSPEGLTVPVKLKLLNINGVAKLRRKDYKGSLLEVSEEWNIPLRRSKDKQGLVNAVQESMLNLFPSAHYLGTNVETDMGFIIDAECRMNTKVTPLPIFDKKTKERIGRYTQKGFKVAVLVWSYQDMTRGRRGPTGVSKLCRELIQLKGYRTVIVDFVDFSPRSKLVARVQYLNQKLKASVEQK